MMEYCEALANDIVDLYEDIDPWGQMSAFDSRDDALASCIECLTTWTAKEMKMAIIDDLKKYAKDGYDDPLLGKVLKELVEWAEMRGLDTKVMR